MTLIPERFEPELQCSHGIPLMYVHVCREIELGLGSSRRSRKGEGWKRKNPNLTLPLRCLEGCAYCEMRVGRHTDTSITMGIVIILYTKTHPIGHVHILCVPRHFKLPILRRRVSSEARPVHFSKEKSYLPSGTMALGLKNKSEAVTRLLTNHWSGSSAEVDGALWSILPMMHRLCQKLSGLTLLHPDYPTTGCSPSLEASRISLRSCLSCARGSCTSNCAYTDCGRLCIFF